MKLDLMSQLRETSDFIRKRTNIKPQVGITLGSGLGAFADQVKIDVEIPYNELPHFVPPTVEGHHGKLILGTVNDVHVAMLKGRIHYYEGNRMEQVVYPTRVLAQLGIARLILTNAAGGLNPDMKPGDLMIIRDHINLMANNPLIGPNVAELGLRFPDMTKSYDPEMVRMAEDILESQNIRYYSGVYCAMSGPTYETPAEVQMLQRLGGDAVGMSTVPEAIAARHMGVRIFGMSFISNPAAGISANPITHDEVTEAAKQVEKKFSDFMSEFIKRIGK